MATRRNPIPKTQVELSQDTIQPYDSSGKAPVPANKRRENQRTRANDTVKDFTVGLTDIDTAIMYYFNNVIRPSVIQNGVKVNVPIIYGSPEKWASAQKDGFYRDRNGKIQVPLIMFKRDSVEKNRSIGNKLDANNPIHFGIFEKRYSKKNVYDRFSALSNREPAKEYYGVIIPDYVNLVYSCTIFTEYTEQMNPIVEGINFASDSYWGDPQRFNFRASIDNYTTAVEVTQGEDRNVKTTFQIKLAGYIIPNTINANIGNSNKFFSKSALKFGLETAGSTEVLNAAAGTAQKEAPSRFFDQNAGKVVNNNTITQTFVTGSGLTPEERDYLALTAVVDTTNTAYNINSGLNKVTFIGVTIETPPSGFSALTVDDYKIFINGLAAESSAITSVIQNAGNVEITFNNNLGYTIVNGMEITAVGKFII